MPGYIASELDAADIFLIFGDNEAFEAQIAPVLDNYEGDTPIFRTTVTYK